MARAAFGQRIATEDLETEGAYVVVDAILAELQKPTPVMDEFMDRRLLILPGECQEFWKAMIQHIRDGGK
ncbi:MAG: hypothetical protein ACR2OM_06705, partial [Aestuariivirgaceae bacterium]